MGVDLLPTAQKCEHRRRKKENDDSKTTEKRFLLPSIETSFKYSPKAKMLFPTKKYLARQASLRSDTDKQMPFLASKWGFCDLKKVTRDL